MSKEYLTAVQQKFGAPKKRPSTALDVLKGAYASIKGHWVQGALMRRSNRHPVTMCAMGAIMWQLQGEGEIGYSMAHSMESGESSHIKETLQNDFLDDDPNADNFRWATNHYNLNDDAYVGDKSHAAREATVLLAEALGFEGWADGDFTQDGYLGSAADFVISTNDAGAGSTKKGVNKSRDAIYRGFRKAIKQLEAN